MVPVWEVAGSQVSQVVLGSSANPVLHDHAIGVAMVAGRQPHDGVSFDVNLLFPGILCDLTRMGATYLLTLVARHQFGRWQH